MSGVASGCLGHFPLPPAADPVIALARKYRPRRFADLLVQDHVAVALAGAVARNRVGHGYLLTGPRGVGKTTAARILAMALNCERPDPARAGEPCGECTSCQRIWSGAASLDVVEIDAASNRGVDDARELRERAMYAPSQAGHHKVYIVDEAHMLTREAWNALLKILEEPPPGVVFVFATTEPQKIANTASPVLSRLQRFDFHRIGPAAIRDRLRQVLTDEGLTADEDALLVISRHADGGMRDALSVLDQCLSFGGDRIEGSRVREVLGLAADELYAEALALVADRNPGAVFPLVDRLVDAGSDLTEFVGGLADLLRSFLLTQLGSPPGDLTERIRHTIDAAREKLTAEDGVRMLRLLADTEAAVRRSANPRLALETLLLRWAVMDRTVDLEAVLSGSVPPASGGGPAPSSRARSAAPRAAREVGGAPAGADPGPAPGPTDVSAGGTSPVAFTRAGVAALWPEVVKSGGPLLAPALQACEVIEVDPPTVTVRLPVENTVHTQAIERDRANVERFLQSRLGAPAMLRVEGPPTGAPTPPPKRLTERTLRSERLQGLRGTDPALDAAMDELDLEIVEERPPGSR